MGTYTTNLKFYKPAATEFVDVDAQLNRNWNIADMAVRRLLEYEYSAATVPDVSTDISMRGRFYKAYSNAIIAYFKASNVWWQDPTARVDTWTMALQWFTEGYNFSPTGLTAYYRTVKKASGATTTMVEWAGAFYETGGRMELNTNIVVVGAGGLPPEIRPTVNKYFTVWAGNTSSDFSIARVLIRADGGLEFKRYGVDPSSGFSDENRVEFTGIRYNIEVAGT